MVVPLTRVGIEFECALGTYSSCREDFDGAASWTFTAEITSAYVRVFCPRPLNSISGSQARFTRVSLGGGNIWVGVSLCLS